MKKEQGKDLLFEEAFVMGNGLSIWHVHIERTRERDKNARVMDKDTFDLLTSNIQKDSRLESLPYGYIATNPSGNQEFFIISGHHRVRAARSAGIETIYVIADSQQLSEDEIKSKQLSHNAISGRDDEQLLREIFDSIRDVDSKLRSGVTESDISDAFRPVKLDTVEMAYDYRTVRVLFLNVQIEKLDEVLNVIAGDDTVLVAPIKDFDKFVDTIQQSAKIRNVRNISALLNGMVDIVREHYKLDEFKADPNTAGQKHREGNTGEVPKGVPADRPMIGFKPKKAEPKPEKVEAEIITPKANNKPPGGRRKVEK